MQHYLTTPNHAQLAIQTLKGKEPGILFCGGYASNMNGTKATYLLQLARKINHAITLFDYQGCGQSTGNPKTATVGNWIQDSLTALQYAVKTTAKKWILIGSSMGAWMTIKILEKYPQNIHSMILISPAPDFPQKLLLPNFPPDEQKKLQNGQTASWTEEPKTPPQGYQITPNFLKDSIKHNILDNKKPIPCPVPLRALIGMKDETIPLKYMLKCVQQLNSTNVNTTLFPNGKHRLSDENALNELELRVKEMINLKQRTT